MNDNERRNELQYSKFQPAMPDGFKLPGQTRLFLEYDATGNYIEYDRRSGKVVETGVIEQPEKESVVTSEAA
mgnify:CR=1 FL=1